MFSYLVIIATTGIHFWANTGGDPISGSTGWVGAGLLGSVLAWLLFVHLPAKDKQIKDLITDSNLIIQAKDEAYRQEVKYKDEVIIRVTDHHSKSISTVVEHCRQEAKIERDMREKLLRDVASVGDRYHKEMISALNDIHKSTRECIHAVRNLSNTIMLKQRLSDAFQSADVPAWTKNLEGTILSWNHAAEKVLGWKQGEVVGHSIYHKIVPIDLRIEEENVLSKIARGDRIDEYESYRLSKSGERIKLRIITIGIKDQSGKIVGASVIANEVSD